MRGNFNAAIDITTVFCHYCAGRRTCGWGEMSSGCKCFCWSRVADYVRPCSEYFTLPDAIPQWPQGSGFATSRIKLGAIEVCQITKFEFIWGYNLSMDGKNGVSFYKPDGIPDGFFCLGHYCQSNEKPLCGYVLVARDVDIQEDCCTPALSNPVDYSLVWSSEEGGEESFDGCGYFWLPQPPEGYRATGFLVGNNPKKPDLNEIKCVRADLTDPCKVQSQILCTHSKLSKAPLIVCTTKPLHAGMQGRGVSVGTFNCSSSKGLIDNEPNVVCLKNLDHSLHAMPNMDQIHALVSHYGPTIFFHPAEVYLASSVSWFFQNGALLYSASNSAGEAIDAEGSNLPTGGTNDGKYWLDLPSDNRRAKVKHGNLESAKLYVHVKPAIGGAFTDVVLWIFAPFNGPGTLKLGTMNIAFTKVGQHVGDWEHVTLRISNFTGELWSMYFSQHSSGEWVNVTDLEFIKGNKPTVYASRNGHANFPHPGDHIQGSPKLGIGVRNDAAHSNYSIDSSNKYEIVAAEYLGDGAVDEPVWLQYMREWGPKVVYGSKTELDRIINSLPLMVRCSLENILGKLPLELYGERGPTGPKEKDNWIGDERS
ncbi:hypothetical protein At1g04090-like [Andrographis paniculata]|uniref:hypothetical protein At1g04090-like n=1 Tax=Andrographis paniculata TaxID=175694 RepID=UPI0021E78622|nr:hypothetical protein At1g04090-like [Andrographis paniculata]